MPGETRGQQQRRDRALSDQRGSRVVRSTVASSSLDAAALKRASRQTAAEMSVAGVDEFGRTIGTRGTASTRTVDTGQSPSRVPGTRLDATFDVQNGGNRIGKGGVVNTPVSGLEVVVQGGSGTPVEQSPPEALLGNLLSAEITTGNDLCRNFSVIDSDPTDDDGSSDDVQSQSDIPADLDPCNPDAGDEAQSNIWLDQGVEPGFPAQLQGCYSKDSTGRVQCLWVPDDPDQADTSIGNDCSIFGDSYNCVDGQCIAVDGNGGTYANIEACQTSCNLVGQDPTKQYEVTLRGRRFNRNNSTCVESLAQESTVVAIVWGPVGAAQEFRRSGPGTPTVGASASHGDGSGGIVAADAIGNLLATVSIAGSNVDTATDTCGNLRHTAEGEILSIIEV